MKLNKNYMLIVLTCALAQGYTLDCRDNVGGVKEVYMTELDNVSSTTAAAGVITAITMVTTKQFWKYQLEKETGALVEKPTTNDQNGTVFYEQDLDFTIRKLQATTRNELINVAKNRLAIIVLDRNGKYWLTGLNNGMEMQTSEAHTGKGMGDQNGYALKFKGKEEIPMMEVSSSIITALLSPAA